MGHYLGKSSRKKRAEGLENTNTLLNTLHIYFSRCLNLLNLTHFLENEGKRLLATFILLQPKTSGKPSHPPAITKRQDWGVIVLPHPVKLGCRLAHFSTKGSDSGVRGRARSPPLTRRSRARWGIKAAVAVFLFPPLLSVIQGLWRADLNFSTQR